MALSLEEGRRRLIESGLMSAAELEEFFRRVAAKAAPADGDALLGDLVDSGKLTGYQQERIRSGQTQGLVLGSYAILEPIGRGGMGEVFKAWDRGMNRPVAVKTLPPETVVLREVLQRFQREAEAVGRLNHPNVVSAHYAGQSQGTHYLVMEYVDGRDLAKLVEQGGLPVDRAVDYVIQAAQGVEAAHQRGVVHRDLKPQNLLLDAAGTVKVTDLGLARLTQPAAASPAEPSLTGRREVMGTFAYMAPEQGSELHAADQRSDIYSLGCTLYHLLTGRPPYGGADPVEQLLAHRQEPIPSLRDARPDVPPLLDAVFRKMVAKRPEDRYQSMREVIIALEDTRRLHIDTGRSPLGQPTTRSPAPPRGRFRARWPWIAGAAIAAAALAAAMVAIVIMATRPPAQQQASGPPSKPKSKAFPQPPVEPKEQWSRKEVAQFCTTIFGSSEHKNPRRMLCTEVSVAIDQGWDGTWGVGSGLTKDGKAYEVTVRQGKFFARVLSAEEQAAKNLIPMNVQRDVDPAWQLPLRQVALLKQPQLRVVTDPQGARRLVGSLQCDLPQSPYVEHLNLVFICLGSGKVATVDHYQSIAGNQIPSGALAVDREIQAESDLSRGGRFFLQAFVFEPKASFFRLSNELLWVPEDAKPVFKHKDLYDFVAGIVRDEEDRRMIYTEIAVTMDRRQNGACWIGSGLTKDKKGYKLSTGSGSWSSSVLDAAEQAKVDLEPDSVFRGLPTDWDWPVQQLARLSGLRFRVDPRPDGSSLVTLTLECAVASPQVVQDLMLVYEPAVEKGQHAVELRRHLAHELGPYRLTLERTLKPGVRPDDLGCVYLRAFLLKPEANVYRISNKLRWPDDAVPEEKTPAGP